MSRKKPLYPRLLARADELLTTNETEYNKSRGYDPEEGAVVDAMTELGIDNILKNSLLRDALVEGVRIRQVRKSLVTPIDPKE